MLDGLYSSVVTSRERTATSTRVVPTLQVTLVGGATMTLKDKMTSGGSVSLGFIDGMYDSPVTEGLGVTEAVSKMAT